MTLFLVGGGPSQATGLVFDRFIEAARERGPRIAIAILGAPDEAGSSLDMYAEPITSRWPDAMIEPIWLVDEDEGPIAWPTEPEQLGGLIVAGGWTTGYLDALMPRKDELSRLVRSGVPYLGFSAGAQIVAKHAIAGGWQWKGRPIGPEVAGDGSTELVIRDGLSFIGATVDVHTDTQHLLERAISAIMEGVVTSAVTIDDSTALVIDTASGTSQIIGPGVVHWLNRDGAEVRIRRSSVPPTPRTDDDPAAQHASATE